MKFHDRYSVRIKVEAPFACFSRPESGSDRYSYEAPTPSAVQGLLDACFFKHGMRWVPTSIQLLKAPRFVFMTTNGAKDKVSPRTIQRAIDKGEDCCLDLSGDRRTQISMGLLRDVAYIIVAVPVSDDSGLAHEAQCRLLRNVRRGKLRDTPYLGMREMFCNVMLPEGDERPVKITKPLGLTLFGIAYNGTAQPVFFTPWLIDGIIDVDPRNVLPDAPFEGIFGC